MTRAAKAEEQFRVQYRQIHRPLTLCVNYRIILMVGLLMGLAAPAPSAPTAPVANWPQFRGPGGWPVGDGLPAPVHFGPASNVLWKTALPLGHSSPCIWGDRIFLTGFDKSKLETLCLDRRTGNILWRQTALGDNFEKTHKLGNPAASTCATDGEGVYVYFGSYGLLAYSLAGQELWRRPLPAPMVEFGTGTSPIVAGNRVILVCDQDLNSFLLAVDRQTGQNLWKTPRPEFRRGFATPFLWQHDGAEELIVPGSIWLKSYNLADGSERWTYIGTARVAAATPTAGEGLLFNSSWNIGGDAGTKYVMPPFAEYAQDNDKDGNGKISLNEVTSDVLKSRFNQMDLDKDGFVTPEEWGKMVEMFALGENAVLAIKPGGRGDLTASHLAWKVTRGLPYVASPLYYRGRVHTVRDGGMVSCYQARTGKALYQDERLNAPGEYYSSFAAANGNLYIASQKGVVTVLAAGDEFKIVARNELGEETFATPAIVEGVIYYRTTKNLYAFGGEKRE